MANITIKRYNGTGWDDLYPLTKVANITDGSGTGLATLLSNKENTSNKVTSLSGSSTDTQYPSAKLVYDQLTDIREVAEGKNKAFTTFLMNGTKLISSDTQPTLNSTYSSGQTETDISTYDWTTNDVLNITKRYIYCLLKVNNTYTIVDYIDRGTSSSAGNCHLGDNLFIADLDVPDLWVSAINTTSGSEKISFCKLETTKVNLSSYVTAVSYDSSSHKITYTKSSGSTDVVDLDSFASLNTETGKITIGGVEKTPIYAHQSLDSYSTKANTVSNVSYSNGKIQKTINGTTTDVLTVKIDNGVITIGSTSITPLTSHQSLSGYVPTSRTINGLDLTANRTLYAETVYANKTVYGSGSTAPTLDTGRSYYTGDIWFNYSS